MSKSDTRTIPLEDVRKSLVELAREGGTLRLPPGRYVGTRPLVLPSNVTLTGEGKVEVEVVRE